MLIKQTWQYLPAQIIAPAVQFLSVLIWAHILPVEEIGKATLVIAMQDLLYAALFMWWSHFMLRYLPRYSTPEQRSSFLQAEWIAIVGCTVVQVIAILVAIRLYFTPEPAPFFYAAATAFVTVRSLANYFSERARSDVRILLYTTIQAILPAFGLALSVVFVLYIHASAEFALLAMMIPQLIGIIFAAVLTDVRGRGCIPDIDVLKQAMVFGLPVTLGSLLAVVALNAPRFIIDQSLGLAAAGIFAVSYGLGIRASSFSVMLVTAGAYPLAVRKMESGGVEAAYGQLASNMILVALAVAPVACGLIGINTSVIDTFLPEQMRETAYFLLPLSTLCGLFRYLRSHTTDQVFLITAKPRYVTIIATLDLILAISLTFVGLANFGLWGAVLGPLAAAITSWITSLVAASLKLSFRFPAWPMFRIISAAVVMMVAVLALPPTTSPVLLFGHVILGAAIYIVCLMMFFPRRTVHASKTLCARGKSPVVLDSQ